MHKKYVEMEIIMKIVIVNGSPRKGNTNAAIEAFASGADKNNEIEIIQADKLNISGCKGCGVCQCSKGCFAKDDTNKTIDKLVDADMIVFATPVYWWGMTAQLKLVIDKCYCRGVLLKGKNVGFIVIGGAPTDNVQYELIDKQFKCMSDYLDWNIKFSKKYSANAVNELADNSEVMAELKAEGSRI